MFASKVDPSYERLYLARAPTAEPTEDESAEDAADTAASPRVVYGGSVQYQVVSAPVGAMVTVLPSGCTTYMRGGIAYRQCGGTYYQPVGGGFRVVVF